MNFPYVSNQPYVKQHIFGQIDTSNGKVLSHTVIYAASVINGEETPLNPDNPNHVKWFESVDTKANNKE